MQRVQISYSAGAAQQVGAVAQKAEDRTQEKIASNHLKDFPGDLFEKSNGQSLRD